jgi:hypothetical protein
MKITARKVSCLLKDSVTYSAQAYRNLTKEEADSRIFSTDIRFLPTAQEVMRFEAIMNEAMSSTPELVLFIDPFQLVRVAREDVKLAELLFRQGQKKMLIHQQQTAAQNQQQTIEGQIKSAQAAEEAKGKNMAMKIEMEAAQAEAQGISKLKEITLQGVFELAKIAATPVPVSESGKAAKEGSIPKELQQLMKLSIENIAIPLAMETHEMANGEQQPQPEQIQQEPQPQVAA